MKAITFILLLIGLYGFSQETPELPKTISSGTITLITEEVVHFSNLYFEDDQVRYFNDKTQKEEHLFLPSISSIKEVSSGNVIKISDKLETSNIPYSTTSTKQSSTAPKLKDGIYNSLEDLKKGTPLNDIYTLKTVSNSKSNQFFVLDEKGKKQKKAFALVQNGILYIHGKSIKLYLKNKNALQFIGNNATYLKMDEVHGNYISEANFTNNTLSILGAVASGIIGGALAPGVGSAVAIAIGGSTIFYLISIHKKSVVLDIQNQGIILEKLH